MIKMRIRNIKNASQRIKKCEAFIEIPQNYCGNYQELFKNNHEIQIEIGCGKGQFIYEKALRNPNINFIGIEKYDSILVRAIEKVEENPLPNLKFILEDAKNLETIFKNEISCLYLNFSDPWPKKRHAKRRLTSPLFLEIYEKIFKQEKIIIQKTDNLTLFASSLKDLNNFGYTFIDVSLDYNDEENIETEYESKFRKQGIKINYLKATKK